MRAAPRRYRLPALPDGLVRVVRGLRTPRGFPGPAHKAKKEWDAAIVRGDGGEGPAEILLLAEPASLAFAHQLACGAWPPDNALAPVWEALTTAPRLRCALHQDETSRAVREAMLHPDDLLAAVAAQVAGSGSA